MPDIQTLEFLRVYNTFNLGVKVKLLIRTSSGDVWELITAIKKTKKNFATWYQITTETGRKTGRYTSDKVTVELIYEDW